MIKALLIAPIFAWEYDLRRMEEEKSNLYLNLGEKVEVILGGSAGTGGQWIYGFTNPFIFNIIDQSYLYEPKEPGMTGGPFKLALNM